MRKLEIIKIWKKEWYKTKLWKNFTDADFDMLLFHTL